MKIPSNSIWLLLFCLCLSLSSCRLGEFLSEADPETEAEVSPKLDSLQQDNDVNVDQEL